MSESKQCGLIRKFTLLKVNHSILKSCVTVQTLVAQTRNKYVSG